MKKLLALSLMACMSIGAFAAHAASDPGGVHDPVAMVKTMDADTGAVAAAEPVTSNDADAILIGAAPVSESSFAGHDDPVVTGLRSQADPTKHERTCQNTPSASPRAYAAISHTETHKPNADGRHWTSWRLQG